MRLDEIDRGIVARLVDDARSSFRAIGEAVGLSAPAVISRACSTSTGSSASIVSSGARKAARASSPPWSGGTGGAPDPS